MKKNIAALIVGIIFALGLGISGMTRPEKVIGFLNIFGDWDASLAFVMAGAIVVHALAYQFIRRRGNPMFSKEFYVPHFKKIDSFINLWSLHFRSRLGFGWLLPRSCNHVACKF